MAAISILAGGVLGMISALATLIFFEFNAMSALAVWSLGGIGFAALIFVFAWAARSIGKHPIAAKAA